MPALLSYEVTRTQRVAESRRKHIGAMCAYYAAEMERARQSGIALVMRQCSECRQSFDALKRYVKRHRCPRCAGAAHYARATATSLVNRAIHLGRLLPAHSYRCTDCPAWAEQYDHRDYGKPYLVEPVCASCNCRRGPARVGLVTRAN